MCTKDGLGSNQKSRFPKPRFHRKSALWKSLKYVSTTTVRLVASITPPLRLPRSPDQRLNIVQPPSNEKRNFLPFLQSVLALLKDVRLHPSSRQAKVGVYLFFGSVALLRRLDNFVDYTFRTTFAFISAVLMSLKDCFPFAFASIPFPSSPSIARTSTTSGCHLTMSDLYGLGVNRRVWHSICGRRVGESIGKVVIKKTVP